jgi:hypothetical protein
MQTYIESKELRRVVIRLQKAHSSFFYFIMESNDNIAFYSTLKESIDRDHRDVQVTVTPEFSKSLDNIIKHFETRYPVEYISDIIINED